MCFKAVYNMFKLSVGGGCPAPPPSLILRKCVDDFHAQEERTVARLAINLNENSCVACLLSPVRYTQHFCINT